MSLLSEFLKAASRVLDEAYAGTDKSFPHPGAFFLMSLALSFTSAVLNSPVLWIASGLYSITWGIVLRPRLKPLLSITSITLLLALVPGVPILFTGFDALKYPVPVESRTQVFAFFVARVALSPMPLIVSLTGFGWASISASLRGSRVLSRYVSKVDFFLLNTRHLTVVFADYLAARESRVVSRARSTLWRALAMTIADIIGKFTVVSRDLVKAYESRCVENC
ncbi:hypothetical protein [Thermogladius sp.]|uniref:hypothetical protein n=1 Tax=Thermogladius sp. TaxID=2023064 RepID=UPI003D0DB655